MIRGKFHYFNIGIFNDKNPFTQNFQNEYYFNYPIYSEQYNEKKIQPKNNNNTLLNNNENEILTNNINNNNNDILIIDTSKNNFNENITNHKINNTSIYSSNNIYWEKREEETKNKINEIKKEKKNKIEKESKNKPEINKRSNYIANKLINNNENVFDRLTNGNFERKYSEKIKNISESLKQNKNPNINLVSKNIERSINDLYIWKDNIERKKRENIINMNKI